MFFSDVNDFWNTQQIEHEKEQEPALLVTPRSEPTGLVGPINFPNRQHDDERYQPHISGMSDFCEAGSLTRRFGG